MYFIRFNFFNAMSGPDLDLLHCSVYVHKTTCIRNPYCLFDILLTIQLHFERPRMYIFSYAVSDADTNELFSEYHLGRRAFRYKTPEISKYSYVGRFTHFSKKKFGHSQTLSPNLKKNLLLKKC